jgi:ethanolamine permease
MAVFGAVIAYILQMASFLILRRNLPAIERPYVSPFGVVGAVLATVISAVTLIVLFQNPDYNKGVWGAAVWFGLGIAYFAVYARRRLVMSPEEDFAMHARKGTGASEGPGDGGQGTGPNEESEVRSQEPE